MKKTILFFGLLLSGAAGFAQCGPWNFPNFNMNSPEKESFQQRYPGKTFQLSQDYPARNTVNARGMAWERIDFTAQPEQYMDALLKYCLEGMEVANFEGQNNKVRKWYHAPWLDAGKLGREPIHGLVMQRALQPNEIKGTLSGPVKTYSLSMYNEAGGFTLGEVWCNPKKPDATKAVFPAGTVAFKMVFIAADSASVPSLAGGLYWDAWIDPAMGDNKKRSLQKVALYEISIAVKTDNPKAKTGWVYANYVFGRQGKNLAEKFWPVGLAWGQDEGITGKQALSKEKTLAEQWINEKVFKEEDRTRSEVKHLGWGNRLAGVTDNAGTSCMSCHSTASTPMKVEVIPVDTLKDDTLLLWYRNLKGEPFRKGLASLDYSMDLAMGIRNFMDSEGLNGGEVFFRGTAKELMEIFTAPKSDEVVEVVLEPGLSTSRRKIVFIFFVSLIVVMIGLLGFNLFKKDKTVE